MPQYFVTATVLPSVAPSSTLHLPLSVRVEELIASRNPTTDNGIKERFNKGRILEISIKAYSMDFYQSVKPSDYQGTLDFPISMTAPDIISNLAGNEFVFGLDIPGQAGADAQIWSMKTLGLVKQVLAQSPPSCAASLVK